MYSYSDYKFLNELKSSHPKIHTRVMDILNSQEKDIAKGCHDLLNIVTLINGNLQLVGLIHPELNREKHMQSATECLSNLTDALSAISIYRHAREIQPAMVNIEKLLNHLKEMYSTANLNISCSGNLPTLMLDYNKTLYSIRGMLHNILEIDPSATISINAYTKDCSLILQICDNLTGLTPEAKEALFKPFNTTKCDHIGLSLAIAYQNALAHNGNMLYSENAPTGSIFTICFPICS